MYASRRDRAAASDVLHKLTASQELTSALRKLYNLYSALAPAASIRGSQSLAQRISQMPTDKATIAAVKDAIKEEGRKVAVAAVFRSALYPTANSTSEMAVGFAISCSTDPATGNVDVAKACAVASSMGGLIAAVVAENDNNLDGNSSDPDFAGHNTGFLHYAVGCR